MTPPTMIAGVSSTTKARKPIRTAGIVKIRRRHRCLGVESLDDQIRVLGIALAKSTGTSGGAETGTGQEPHGLDHDNSAFVAAIFRRSVALGVGGDRIVTGTRITDDPGDPFDGKPSSTVDLADGSA